VRGKFFQGRKLRKSFLDRRIFERGFPTLAASKGTIALCGTYRCAMGDTATGSSQKEEEKEEITILRIRRYDSFQRTRREQAINAARTKR
jgi:hypothetical protein